MNPLTYLRQAQKQYPQLRFAWGLVGIAAAAAIIGVLLKGQSGAAVAVIMVLMIAGMFVLSSFARTTKQSPFRPAALFLVWVCTAAFTAVLFLVLSAAAFDVPKTLADRLFVRAQPSLPPPRIDPAEVGPSSSNAAERAAVGNIDRLLQQLTEKIVTRAGLAMELREYVAEPVEWRWTAIQNKVMPLLDVVGEMEALLHHSDLSRFAVEQNPLYERLLTLLRDKRMIFEELKSIPPYPHASLQLSQITDVATKLETHGNENDATRQALLAYLQGAAAH